MKKQGFKMIDEERNIFEIGGFRIQVIDNSNYKLSDSFKPNIYRYDIMDDNDNTIYTYIGKSFCGCSSRFCDHTTHNTQRIDYILKEAREKKYLIRIQVTDIVSSIAEMDLTEEKRIHNLCKETYNEMMNEETNYENYNLFSKILSSKILNDILY